MAERVDPPSRLRRCGETTRGQPSRVFGSPA
jgi:hypothetical protein